MGNKPTNDNHRISEDEIVRILMEEEVSSTYQNNQWRFDLYENGKGSAYDSKRTIRLESLSVISLGRYEKIISQAKGDKAYMKKLIEERLPELSEQRINLPLEGIAIYSFPKRGGLEIGISPVKKI